MKLMDNQYHILGSRIFTHVSFWVVYYIFFGLLWAEDGDYYKSFGLELVLLPLRMSASYLVIYFLIPKQLLQNRELRFGLSYFVVIIIAGIAQRIFIYFYFELLFEQEEVTLFEFNRIIRAIVLVNTTVLLLSAFKIFQYWKIEHSKQEQNLDEAFEIRADKRTHLVRPSEIFYVEALGNYVIYHLKDQKRLTSYNSLKKIVHLLPHQFTRIHKSYVINKDYITSYSNEDVEIAGKKIPIGKSNELTL